MLDPASCNRPGGRELAVRRQRNFRARKIVAGGSDGRSDDDDDDVDDDG